MKILLYGINFSPELTGIGKYSGEFARWCAEHGYEVRVVTAPAYYPDWKVAKQFSSYRFQSSVEDGITVTRCPLYVPSRPTALKRILHLTSFALTSTFALLSCTRWRPDLVIQVAPTLLCAVSTRLFCGITKATSVLHIQDYEVDAMFGLSMAKGHALRNIAHAIERFLLGRFDRVSTISAGMIKRAVEKGVDPDKLILFPNWSEIERFKGARKDGELLASLGVDPNRQVVLYSGSMGEKQGLESILEAAAHFADRDDIQFLLVGEGGAKRRLVSIRDEKRLENVVFAPLQPYDFLPGLLASVSCHLVVQKRGAADAVLPSKLTNILAVGGNSVVTADDDTTLGELACAWPGIVCLAEPESVDALINGIEHALAMPRPNHVAIEYAESHLAKQTLIQNFLSNLFP